MNGDGKARAACRLPDEAGQVLFGYAHGDHPGMQKAPPFLKM